MIELEQMTVSYKSDNAPIVAVRDVQMKVKEGELLAVRGSSGAGKSSLLLAAGGLLRPSEGRVLIGGDDLYSRAPQERAELRGQHIGFIFQSFHLLPYLSVRQNILAPTLAINVPDAEERADELIAQFGLEDRVTHEPSKLSAGERQRVATARALLTRPRVILADEPTGNLDSENSKVVLDAIRAAVDHGCAAILVTHDDEAAAYADRTVQIQGGVLCD